MCWKLFSFFFFFFFLGSSAMVWSVSFVKPSWPLKSPVFIRSTLRELTSRSDWRGKKRKFKAHLWSLLIKWKHSGIPAAGPRSSNHVRKHSFEGNRCGCSQQGKRHGAPAIRHPSSCAAQSRARMTCNTPQFVSINKRGNVLPERGDFNSKASLQHCEEMLPH